MFWIFIIPALVEEAMFGDPGEDDDDDRSIEKRYGKAVGSYYLGQWFGIRELGGWLKYGQLFETPLQRLVASPAKAVEEAFDQAFDEDAEFDEGSIRAVTDMLPVLGFPTGAQVNRMAKYLYKYEEEGGDFSLWGFLVTGRHDE